MRSATPGKAFETGLRAAVRYRTTYQGLAAFAGDAVDGETDICEQRRLAGVAPAKRSQEAEEIRADIDFFDVASMAAEVTIAIEREGTNTACQRDSEAFSGQSWAANS